MGEWFSDDSHCQQYKVYIQIQYSIKPISKARNTWSTIGGIWSRLNQESKYYKDNSRLNQESKYYKLLQR